MTKLRKQRRRKVFRHSVNRKRLRNKLHNVGTISCNEIKQAWETKKSIACNLDEMGLAYDSNKAIKCGEITGKKQLLSLMRRNNADTEELTDSDSDNDNSVRRRSKTYVVDSLEQEAKAPRVKRFRLPKGQVEKITYLMDKYGKDYKAMARDSRNYYQETWKQIRAKIKRFKSIEEQYNKYLESREDLLAESDDSICSSDGDL